VTPARTGSSVNRVLAIPLTAAGSVTAKDEIEAVQRAFKEYDAARKSAGGSACSARTDIVLAPIRWRLMAWREAAINNPGTHRASARGHAK
jgi:hypothetical protein